uniref:Uncharacterized protein n=2 Tax=Meloidogyne TaxID=189290 RepID=A0A6V7WSK7_MELEN|nr:unnamed protein product [Meloidogyne enterolobii]
MSSLNNIFLLILFLNLFEQINCDCLKENSMFCAVKNKNKIINKCCPGLTCATKADGRSFCTMGTCANTAGADCDPGGKYCCPGLICSTKTNTCETCLKDGEYCAPGSPHIIGIYNFKCCKKNCGKVTRVCGGY